VVVAACRITSLLTPPSSLLYEISDSSQNAKTDEFKFLDKAAIIVPEFELQQRGRSSRSFCDSYPIWPTSIIVFIVQGSAMDTTILSTMDGLLPGPHLGYWCSSHGSHFSLNIFERLNDDIINLASLSQAKN
jgi:hypothetical protein